MPRASRAHSHCPQQWGCMLGGCTGRPGSDRVGRTHLLTPRVAAASHPLQAAGRPLSPPPPLRGHVGTCWDAWVPGQAKEPFFLPYANLAPSLCGPPISIGLAPRIPALEMHRDSRHPAVTCGVSEQGSARHFLMGYCDALIYLFLLQSVFPGGSGAGGDMPGFTSRAHELGSSLPELQPFPLSSLSLRDAGGQS